MYYLTEQQMTDLKERLADIDYYNIDNNVEDAAEKMGEIVSQVVIFQEITEAIKKA